MSRKAVVWQCVVLIGLAGAVCLYVELRMPQIAKSAIGKHERETAKILAEHLNPVYKEFDLKYAKDPQTQVEAVAPLFKLFDSMASAASRPVEQ